MINPEYIGFFAATLTTSAFLPQAFKIWKSKKADGLSLTDVFGDGYRHPKLACLWSID
jgi:uncharacterized protein with PQ loop repeat